MSLTHSREGVAVRDTDWVSDISRALRGDGVAVHYQPIVDLVRAEVVGHEALLRFPGHAVASPLVWLDAARALGVGAHLEALALQLALADRPRLPADTFLSVNLPPESLDHPAIQDVLAAERVAGRRGRRAHRGHSRRRLPRPGRARRRLRSAGALVAMDDTGSGYAGLQHLVDIRPDLIKLDRALVAGIDTDPARQGLVELLGAFADRFDAWVVAEGIETEGELDALTRLGVPLGQGYRLAGPGPGWQRLAGPAAAKLLATARRGSGTGLWRLLEETATLQATPEGLTSSADRVELVLLDEHDRRLGLLDGEQHTCTDRDAVLRVNVGTGVVEAAHRAMLRAPEHRFDPLLMHRRRRQVRRRGPHRAGRRAPRERPGLSARRTTVGGSARSSAVSQPGVAPLEA